MKIKILGSGNEIGKSAILIEGEKRVVMDYGVRIQPEPPTYPMRDKFDAAIISHAHLDHIGATPMLAQRAKIPIYMNDVTLELGTMLIKDSMKVAKKEGFGVPFSEQDAKKMVKQTKIVRYNEKFRIGSMECSLWNAGHIPGSSSILINSGKKLLYTGDIQTRNSRLLNGCTLPEKVDTLIIESTYGTRVQENRKREEKKLVEIVEQTISNKGVALVPVLAVGRSQEVMLLLKDYADKIALDGMSRLASEIISDYGSYLRSPKEFRKVLSKVKFLRSEHDRKEAVKKYPIILSSAGMLGGGPAVRYLGEIKSCEHCSVIFTSYLAEDSPGKVLTETKIFDNEEERYRVKASIHHLELSAHADKNGLFDIIRKTKPEQVICVHGEECEAFAKSIEDEFKVQAFVPKNGEVVRV